MSENNNTTINISFSGLLFVVFLILKLTNVIDWSWWWVFSPLWIPFVFVLVLIAILLLALIIINILN